MSMNAKKLKLIRNFCRVNNQGYCTFKHQLKRCDPYIQTKIIGQLEQWKLGSNGNRKSDS